MQLECGHVFHADCVLKLLKHRWNTLKINFAFLACPTCKAEIKETRCASIKTELASLKEFKQKIEILALAAAKK